MSRPASSTQHREHHETAESPWVRVTNDAGATLVDGRYEVADMDGITLESIAASRSDPPDPPGIDGEDVPWFEWEAGAYGSGLKRSTVRRTRPCWSGRRPMRGTESSS